MLLKFTIVVEVPKQDEMRQSDLVELTREYIAEAVGTHKYSLQPPGAEGPNDPGDPMWDLEVRLVRQRRLGG